MRRDHDVNGADPGSGFTTSLWDDFRLGARILRSTPLVALWPSCRWRSALVQRPQSSPS
jgi:hypothetical protein